MIGHWDGEDLLLLHSIFNGIKTVSGWRLLISWIVI